MTQEPKKRRWRIGRPQDENGQRYVAVDRHKIAVVFAVIVAVFFVQGWALGSALLQLKHSRAVNAAKFTRSDQDLCGAFNRIREDDRKTFAQGPKETRLLLELIGPTLGLSKKTVAIIEKQEQREVARELARRPPLKCDQLPSLGVSPTATVPGTTTVREP